MSTASPQELQHRLVEQLKRDGMLRDAAVERAFLTVPRHLFLPAETLERAYSDEAIAVKQDPQGRWISSSSQPSMMAIMLDQLDLRPGMRILEIGTGSGFNAALLAEVVGAEGAVTTVDIQPDLLEAARERLDAAGFGRVETVAGDGGQGAPGSAPFDRIIVTASSGVIPPSWREQLAEGGRLVLPLDLYGTQRSIAFQKRGAVLESTSLSDCGFMHLQGAFASQLPAAQQVGPDPRVTIAPTGSLPEVDRRMLWAWQGGVWSDIGSGVRAAPRELTGGLFLWLALHEQGRLAAFVAEGSRSFPSVIPPLLWMGRGQDYRVMQSLLLFHFGPEGQTLGAAALVRPDWQAAPIIDWNQPGGAAHRAWSVPFALYVREYGHPAAAAALLRSIRAWAAAGKPTSADLRIRAFSAGLEPALEEGELLIPAPWTSFAVRFQKGGR